MMRAPRIDVEGNDRLASRRFPGHKAIVLQPETGKLMVASLWETKAQALFASAFASEKFTEMAPLLTDTMENEIYEMRL